MSLDKTTDRPMFSYALLALVTFIFKSLIRPKIIIDNEAIGAEYTQANSACPSP